MLISIVVTTRNRKRRLLDCISAIRRADLGGFVFEIIVVDDCSSDGTEKLGDADLGADGLRIIHNARNLMMAGARNIGTRATSGKYILFIDDDNEIDKLMIKNLLEFAEKNEKAGIVGPQMHRLDNKEKYFSFQKINFFTGKTDCHSRSSSEFYRSDGIPNVFMARKEVFENCGYFDEELIQTFTEPDLFFRAKEKGYGCFTVEGAKTFHDIGSSRFHPDELGGDFPQKAYCVMRNRSVIIKRYGKFYHKIIYGLFFSWIWPLLYLLAVVRYGRFDLARLYWRGWRDGMVYLTTGRLIKHLSI